jgi:hypothetical protein
MDPTEYEPANTVENNEDPNSPFQESNSVESNLIEMPLNLQLPAISNSLDPSPSTAVIESTPEVHMLPEPIEPIQKTENLLKTAPLTEEATTALKTSPDIDSIPVEASPQTVSFLEPKVSQQANGNEPLTKPEEWPQKSSLSTIQSPMSSKSAAESMKLDPIEKEDEEYITDPDNVIDTKH